MTQLSQFQKEVVTPVGEHKVVIKTMLTGAERETVDNAQMDHVETQDGQTFKVKDMKKVALAEKHALLAASVVSIDGDATNCLDRIGKMWEQDSSFIYQTILDEQKKARGETSKAS